MVTPMTPGYVCVMQTGEAMQVSSKLERIFLAVGWKNRSPQKTVDIDASCVLFSGGKMHSSVSFQNLKNEPDAKGQSSVVHTGDVLTGGEQEDKEKFGDDLERVYIWLPNVTTMVDAMYFIINVYSDGMTFKDCESAYVRVCNADTNQELSRFTLGEGPLVGNAVITGRMHRHGGPDGHWQFTALGTPANGKTWQDVVGQIEEKGMAVCPPAPAVQGKPAPPEPTVAPGITKPQKPVKPTKVSATPILAAAAAAGIGAAIGIFVAGKLDKEMLGSIPTPDWSDIGDLPAPSLCDITDLGTVEDLGDVFSQIGDAAGQVFAAAAEAAASAGEALAPAGEAIGQFAGEAGGAIGNVAGQVAADAPGAIAGAAETAGGAIGDVAQDAPGAIAGAAGEAGSALAPAGDAIASGAADAGGAIAEHAGAAGQVIGDHVGQAAEAMAPAAMQMDGVADQAAAVLGEVAEKAAEVAGEIAENVTGGDAAGCCASLFGGGSDD